MMEVQEPNIHSEHNEMLPPPVGTFQSREELLKHVRDFALTQGYVVSIKDSSKDRYVTICCDRSGVYRKRLKTGENMRKRKAPSRLTNCPFEVVGKKDDELWSLTVKHGEHNHEPSDDITDHPSCRRFTDEEVVIIREMTAAGKRPRHILKVLRQKNPTLVSDSRNVYNVKAKIRREILSGKSMESPSTSSAGTATSGQDVPNWLAMADSTTGYLQTNAVKETKALLSELCHHFYTLGWLLGTGGSITIKAHVDFIPKPNQLIVMSASGSGVQKERMSPEDMYVLSSDGSILLTPPLKPFPHKPPQCSDCAPLFLKVYELRKAGAVIHSHGMEACLVTMIHPLSKELRITHMEMIKGIEGHGYHDELVVPIIENAAHERDLTESLTEAITVYPKTTAVLVRNHGVYIWGDSWISAKTQAECYHYLFDAAIKLHQLGLDSSTPGHGPIRNNGVCGYGNMSRALKTRPLGLDYVNQPSRRCILLGVEGTTTAKSFLTNILLPYAADNVIKYLAESYDSEETQDDIALLRAQIQFDVEQGVVGAVPVAPDYMGKDMVIASLAANVEAMIKTDRKPPSLKQLQGRMWRNGFEGNELLGVVFDDVPEALERWHSSGIKVYVYSTSTREEQHVVLGNSNYGDLRKYLCGFFDTSVGSKSEARSYVEICQTVGVDKRSDMLFITDAIQEAAAARAEGLEVIISVRPGNERLPGNHGFRTIESLLEL